MSAVRQPSDTQQTKMVSLISEAVSKVTGVILGERQSGMVLGRIQRRIVELGLADEAAYLAHFEKNRNEEMKALISLLTTHHTYFFREFAHFEYMQNTALETLIAAKRASGDKVIRIWSAACSRGQEVYSLAMLMHSYVQKNAPDFNLRLSELILTLNPLQ